MADHIPFVNNTYRDSEIIRVSLESIDNIRSRLPGKMALWLDPAVDGYHHWAEKGYPPEKDRRLWKSGLQQMWNSWERLFGDFDGHQILADKDCWIKPYYDRLATFLNALLDKCAEYHPDWLTVPQLPLVNDGSRNKINRFLARTSSTWKRERRCATKLVLPMVFTRPKQLASKPIRDRKLTEAKACYSEAGADGLWVVDTSLVDQQRGDTFPKRYAKLIEFHQLARKAIPRGSTTIVGPYWAINLVLWARGLCDYPAITLGTGYRYSISCGLPKQAQDVRLAIPPLRRWLVTEDLKPWLDKALVKLSPTDPSYEHFASLARDFERVNDSQVAPAQLAKFYKNWFDEIASVPKPGRALALYQDLSRAFVLGRGLPRLPRKAVGHCSKSTQDPGKVAEQLMVQCL
ncbi:MAG: hypothetical protein ACYS29_17100 [Planctomycetota bacterium]|jgi:hypothetical protein